MDRTTKPIGSAAIKGIDLSSTQLKRKDMPPATPTALSTLKALDFKKQKK